MHDIRADLRERAYLLQQEIGAENARFDRMVVELKQKHDNALEHMRAQLRLANKLLEFTAWHDNVRTVLTAHIAAAEAAESSIMASLKQGAETPPG
ncbi:MAG: hypothetical protein AB7V40_08400 [Methyloceanibacter sp.]